MNKPVENDHVGLILTNDWYEGIVKKHYKDRNCNEKVDVLCHIKNGYEMLIPLTIPKYIGEVIKR